MSRDSLGSVPRKMNVSRASSSSSSRDASPYSFSSSSGRETSSPVSSSNTNKKRQSPRTSSTQQLDSGGKRLNDSPSLLVNTPSPINPTKLTFRYSKQLSGEYAGSIGGYLPGTAAVAANSWNGSRPTSGKVDPNSTRQIQVNIQSFGHGGAIVLSRSPPSASRRSDALDVPPAPTPLVAAAQRASPNYYAKDTVKWPKQLNERLFNVVMQHLQKDGTLRPPMTWISVADHVGGGMDHSDCHERWTKCLDPKLNKGPWSEEEDQKFKEAYPMYKGNPKMWANIARYIGTRTGKQVSEHYSDMLSLTVDKSALTKEEEDKIIELRKEGKGWAEMIPLLPTPNGKTRTRNKIRSFFRDHPERFLSRDPEAPAARGESPVPFRIDSQTSEGAIRPAAERVDGAQIVLPKAPMSMVDHAIGSHGVGSPPSESAFQRTHSSSAEFDFLTEYECCVAEFGRLCPTPEPI